MKSKSSSTRNVLWGLANPSGNRQKHWQLQLVEDSCDGEKYCIGFML